MKEEELRKVANCSFCGNGIGKEGPIFWRVRIEQYGLKIDALRRQQGLGMMLGGHGALAMVMGADEDMAEIIESSEITVCQKCAITETYPVMVLADHAKNKEKEFVSKVKRLS